MAGGDTLFVTVLLKQKLSSSDCPPPDPRHSPCHYCILTLNVTQLVQCWDNCYIFPEVIVIPQESSAFSSLWKNKGSNLNFRHIPFRNRKMLTVFQLSSNWIPESAVVRVIIIQKRGWGFSYHTNVLKMAFWAHHIPCWIIVINLTHWLRSVCSFSEARLCRDMKSFLNFHSREEYKKEERWGHILSPAVLKSTQLRVLNPQSGTICKEGQVI